ncbi:MAG: hypothetical protein ABIJ12_02500 [bacterium]
MKKIIKIRIGLVIFGLLTLSIMLTTVSTAFAQEVAVGSATATVLTALTVTSSSGITFGNVYQGVAKTIDNTDADAGIFKVTGQVDAGISLYFQMPEYLALSDGSSRMNISFNSTDCSVDTTGADSPTTMNGTKGWLDTDPRNLPGAVQIGSSGTSIYLGSKVTPSIYQAAGNYSGDIILTVSYNGN